MQDSPHYITDHIATSQLSTIKSQVADFYDDPKEHKEKQDLRGNWLKVCYLLHIIQPQSIFPIFLIIFLNSDIGQLDLTKLVNLFQIKNQGKYSELVP